MIAVCSEHWSTFNQVYARRTGVHKPARSVDPVLAYRRGRALDAMLRSALPPVERGVRRGTAAEFQALDEARARLIAKLVNPE